MEEERMKLDEELKRHREKARRVNIGQEVLEAKIKVPDISDFNNFKSLANLGTKLKFLEQTNFGF